MTSVVNILRISTIEANFSISGVVLDAVENGKPLPGAHIFVNGWVNETNLLFYPYQIIL